MLYIHVVLIALCLLFNKNKTIPLFVLLWLLFININDVARPDYDVYEQWYNESVVVSDKGWFLLSQIFSNFGFSYKTFSTLIYALGYVTLYKLIKRITTNLNIVIALYLIFPCFYDLIQIRFFVVGVLIFVGILYLSKMRVVEYLCIVIIAATFHKIALCYAVFCILTLKQKKIILASLMVLAFFALFYERELRQYLFADMLDSKYITYNYSLISSIVYSSIPIMGFGFIVFFQKNCGSTNQFVDLIKNILLVVSVFFPLILLLLDFYRLYRGVMLEIYVATTLLYQEISMCKNKFLYVFSGFTIILLLAFIFYGISEDFVAIDNSLFRLQII